MSDGQDQPDNPEHAKGVDGIPNARIDSPRHQCFRLRTHREGFAELHARRGPKQKRRNRERQPQFLQAGKRPREAIPHQQKGAKGGNADVRYGAAFNSQGIQLLGSLCAENLPFTTYRIQRIDSRCGAIGAAQSGCYTQIVLARAHLHGDSRISDQHG